MVLVRLAFLEFDVMMHTERFRTCLVRKCVRKEYNPFGILNFNVNMVIVVWSVNCWVYFFCMWQVPYCGIGNFQCEKC